MSFFLNLINILFNNEKYNQNYLDGLDYVVDIPPRKEIQSKKIVEINHDYRQMSREKIKKRQSVSPKKVVFKE